MFAKKILGRPVCIYGVVHAMITYYSGVTFIKKWLNKALKFSGVLTIRK